MLYNLSKNNIDNNGEININIDEDEVFRYSCQNGHSRIVEWLCFQIFM